MKKLYLTIFLLAIFALISISSYAQIIRVDLHVSQPNVEECITNIKNTFKDADFKVFPNPSKGIFTVESTNISNKQRIDLIVYDISGKELICQQIIVGKKFQETIDLRGYKKGTYILFIKGDQDAIFKATLIIY